MASVRPLRGRGAPAGSEVLPISGHLHREPGADRKHGEKDQHQGNPTALPPGVHPDFLRVIPACHQREDNAVQALREISCESDGYRLQALAVAHGSSRPPFRTDRGRAASWGRSQGLMRLSPAFETRPSRLPIRRRPPTAVD